MPRIAVPVPSGTLVGKYSNYSETLTALGAEAVEVDGAVDPGAFHGLLLPGGADISPERYHREKAPGCGGTEPALDALQFAALDAFVRAKKFVFGICRGHQLINVYFGGTLIQHLADRPCHIWDSATGADSAHGTRAVPGSWLAGIYGESCRVNSAHHQAVDRLAGGMTVDQFAEDGIVEAMHHRSLPVYCVQWHPERMCFSRAREGIADGAAALRWFLKACGSARAQCVQAERAGLGMAALQSSAEADHCSL